ncbi:hypothetical protein J5N97_021002 [Dioscorea zingiberensis]|uniref:WW domain-containing protein n=1 Tax=Dioscorea zingiberensis TaxID=325984 RepID=A0A9D5CI98_9LILI|nr:hypothetical protein J5N97_021002 [Dioscorea zingiberensis]
MPDLPFFKRVHGSTPFKWSSFTREITKKESLKTMEDVELSLSTTFANYTVNRSSSSESKLINPYRKRKCYSWDDQPMTHTSIELNPSDPLPLHWEQCLDLQSGRMYYLNRKTSRRSWSRPKEQKLDLELNISNSFSSSNESEEYHEYSKSSENSWKLISSSMSSSSENMMAVACANCHLLVMLCKSSPSCPNCKHMHYSLPKHQAPTIPPKIHAMKPLETLSLLN